MQTSTIPLAKADFVVKGIFLHQDCYLRSIRAYLNYQLAYGNPADLIPIGWGPSAGFYWALKALRY
jgi:hypothetical protein